MALRPFCLILQYSYPLSCSRWRAVGVGATSLAAGILTDCQARIPRTRLRPEHQSGFAKDLDAYPDALAVKAMQGNDRRGA